MAKYLIIIISLILLAGLLLPQAVNAALVPCGRHEDDLTTPEKETDPCNLCHIFMMLQRLLNGIGLVAAGWAIIFIVIGGIVIMTAGGSPDKASQGKRMITYAIIGIVIAFGAWLVINTLMNKLVRPEAMPWPWNKIKCVPTEPIEEGNKICCYDLEGDSYACHTYNSESECKAPEGCQADANSAGAFRWCCVNTQRRCSSTPDLAKKICRCEWEDGTAKTNEYSSTEECNNRCESYCSTPAGPPTFLDRYCCVAKASDTCEGSIIGSEKKHCIGEIPVYTVDPHNYSGKTEVIGTEFKGTELASEDECTQKCAFPGGYVYLPQCNLTDASEGKLYCASQNELEGKTAHCIELKNTSDFLRQFSSQQACIDSVLPDKAEFDKECARFCWVDGNLYCDCANPEGSVYQLRRTKKEQGTGLQNTAWACIRNCGITSGENCRLGSYQEPPECRPEAEDNCDNVKESFSCFGSFTCKNMTTSQQGDACDELKKFLNCMGSKSMPDGAKVISSISDNSGYKCFNTDFWDSVGQCSGGKDSCTWKCCAHKKYSLHYGGYPPGQGGVSGCHQCSWAIDFANEQHYQGIKNVAEVCAQELNYGKVDVILEPEVNPNHVHVELEGVASTKRCK